jgi:hypothetical protein
MNTRSYDHIQILSAKDISTQQKAATEGRFRLLALFFAGVVILTAFASWTLINHRSAAPATNQLNAPSPGPLKLYP